MLIFFMIIVFVPLQCGFPGKVQRYAAHIHYTSNALMIEPTETESQQTLDAFVDAMKKIAPKYIPELALIGISFFALAPPSTPPLSQVWERGGAGERRGSNLTFTPAVVNFSPLPSYALSEPRRAPTHSVKGATHEPLHSECSLQITERS
jgi:hypothetical protein